jgi:hypothetical protein
VKRAAKDAALDHGKYGALQMVDMKGFKRVFGAAAAAGLLVFSSTVAVRNWRGERFLEEARTEQGRGNINGARRLYEKALRGGREEAAVALAKMAFYRRDWDWVRRYATEAVRINPMQSYVHMILAYTRAAEEEVRGKEGVEDVFRECRRAVALDPTDGGLWKSYADLSLRVYVGEVRNWDDEGERKLYRDETVHAFRQALRYDPGKAGEILRAPAEAHPDEEFLPAIVRDLDASSLTAAAALLLESGRWKSDEGTWWYEASKSASPREYYLAAAEALRRRKRHGDAFDVLSRYLAANPDDAEIMYRAAEEASALGRETWDAANGLYLGALQREPESVAYRRGYGMRLSSFGEPEEALRQLSIVAAADPRDAPVHFTMGRMAEKMHDIEGARRHYRRAVSLRPRSRSYRAALEKAMERRD